MNVLALNCGSSSVKFRLCVVSPTAAAAGALVLARGLIERIGGASVVSLERDGVPERASGVSLADHQAAVSFVVDWLRERSAPPDAVGHRVVHGGARLVAPTVIDAAAEAVIEALEALAPLHNAPSLAGIRACRSALGPGMPMVAVFDTAFHASLRERAYRYAIPTELSIRHGIRRFGFHGLSYQHVLARYAALTGRQAETATVVALHLGNGASAAAIEGGRSIDTSMGFTPLEGLVMGTRSGDLDPAVVGYLSEREGVPVAEVERWLNERSGLLGLSGTSRDMRDLLAARGTDARASVAVDVFCYRARKYVGAYLAALGGADAIVFSGGIGENCPEIRAEICERMEWCGLEIDAAANRGAVGSEARISADGARVSAWVIPTDEEQVIALETARRLTERSGLSGAGTS
jgi:acetate kinase